MYHSLADKAPPGGDHPNTLVSILSLLISIILVLPISCLLYQARSLQVTSPLSYHLV